LSSRYIAAKFAVTVFNFNDADRAIICLVAFADSKLEVREIAKAGLTFPSPTLLEVGEYRSMLPQLNDVVKKLELKLDASTGLAATQPGIKYIGSLTTESWTRSIEFLRRLMLVTADPKEGHKIVREADEFGGDAVNEAGGIELTGSLRKSMQVMLGGDGLAGVDGYLNLLEKGLLAPESDALLQAMASACLKELISLSPSDLCRDYYGKLTWITPFVTSLKIETRYSMAHVLATVASFELDVEGRKDEYAKLLNAYAENLETSVKIKAFEVLHGIKFQLIILRKRAGNWILDWTIVVPWKERVDRRGIVGKVCRAIKGSIGSQ
jgi:proteasome component ECM29